MSAAIAQSEVLFLVPTNSGHDARFVGISLAMTQEHFYLSLPPFIAESLADDCETGYST